MYQMRACLLLDEALYTFLSFSAHFEDIGSLECH